MMDRWRQVVVEIQTILTITCKCNSKKEKWLDNDPLVLHFKQHGNSIQGLVVVVFLVVLGLSVDLVFSVVAADRYRT